MTSKEALQDLRKDATKHLDHHIKYLNDRLDIIEKDLKVLELIKKKIMPLVHLEDNSEWSKKEPYSVYDNELYQHTPLTKKEFELLKEWL